MKVKDALKAIYMETEALEYERKWVEDTSHSIKFWKAEGGEYLSWAHDRFVKAVSEYVTRLEKVAHMQARVITSFVRNESEVAE